ncbi:hypothetical protein GCM10010515_01040 [Streptomyces fructofermentans]|uniref:Uncharacterized protein n=1 Tax=Streptomyces fructofermentans TaxID=152141 RepID=A0A918JZN4_9ACTN|nr:hypothetical protein GCM10010515_01040 [Streptomyces fructofermentans]
MTEGTPPYAPERAAGGRVRRRRLVRASDRPRQEPGSDGPAGVSGTDGRPGAGGSPAGVTRAAGRPAGAPGRPVRQPSVPRIPRSSFGSRSSQDFFAVLVSESFTHV